MKRISSAWASVKAFWTSRKWGVKLLTVCIISLMGYGLYSMLDRAYRQRKIESCYDYSIGQKGLQYNELKRRIYNPKTKTVIVDKIEWLHYHHSDTIGILAKDNKRAFINLNTGQLITPLTFDKGWQFSCKRGVLSRNDSLYIFRPDGSQVNAEGIPTIDNYEFVFHNNQLLVKQDIDQYGLLDTAAHWLLEPEYKQLDIDYHHQRIIGQIEEEWVVYDFGIQEKLRGPYKSIQSDWTEGLIVTELDGIQHLYSYDGQLLHKVIYRSIERIRYDTEKTDHNGNTIYAETDCYMYQNYDYKCGLMDKNYRPLTPAIFYDIEAQNKHLFFASFGEYHHSFGTMIDEYGHEIGK